MKLRGILQNRINLLASMKNIYSDYQGLINLIQIERACLARQELITSMESKMFERMSNLDSLKKEETQIKSLILEKLAELTVREIYIELGEGIKTFKEKQEKNINELYHHVNKNDFDEQFDEIINAHERQKDKDIDDLMNVYSDNLKTLITQFK